MKDIQDVSKSIRKEVEIAHGYAMKALDYKESNPAIAEAYFKASTNHLNEATNFHNVVVGIINDYKKLNGDPPEPMRILYNILHKENVENTAAVKGMLALYKGG